MEFLELAKSIKKDLEIKFPHNFEDSYAYKEVNKLIHDYEVGYVPDKTTDLGVYAVRAFEMGSIYEDLGIKCSNLSGMHRLMVRDKKFPQLKRKAG